MGGAFAIQTFFIPILRKNPHEGKYVFLTMLAYLLGGVAYLYIAFIGALGINNCYFRHFKQNSTSIKPSRYLKLLSTRLMGAKSD